MSLIRFWKKLSFTVLTLNQCFVSIIFSCPLIELIDLLQSPIDFFVNFFLIFFRKLGRWISLLKGFFKFLILELLFTLRVVNLKRSKSELSSTNTTLIKIYNYMREFLVFSFSQAFCKRIFIKNYLRNLF